MTARPPQKAGETDRNPQESTVTLKPPKLPGALNTDFSREEAPEDHQTFSGLAMTDVHFINLDAAHITFEKSTMTRAILRGSHLEGLQIKDVRAEDCDFANATWPGVMLRRVEMHNSRLTGARANEAHFQDVLFSGCKCRLAQFRFSTFKAVRFENCDLSEADFQGADLTQVRFVNCDLSSAEMSQAKLAGADLRGCKTDGLHVGLEELRGAMIDPVQAVTLVRSLGIQVDWEDDQQPPPNL
ncbi:MAG: pentapeptide repeat-containing protein [Chloroflexota bacterium]